MRWYSLEIKNDGRGIMTEFQGAGPSIVAGVIVTYQPNHEVLSKLVDAVVAQVDHLFIINNGVSDQMPELDREGRTTVESLGSNLGLAAAQNIGIERAISQNYPFVLLLDQDSLPSEDMVDNLLLAANKIRKQGFLLAAVGPCYVDDRQGEATAFVYREGIELKVRSRSSESDIVEVDFLIASGCLIPADTIRAVGFMEAQLFIDYVDIEWGLRARWKGYKCYGSFGAAMSHSLGDDWISINGGKLPVHSPLRNYYQFRNAVWLAKCSWIGASWRMLIIIRLVKQLILWALFLPRRRDRLKHILIGIFHGWIGRMGKFK